MSHSFVYVNGPHGQLIRGCQNCISSAIFNSNKGEWEPIKEDTGKYILGTAECDGAPVSEKLTGQAAVDAAAKRATAKRRKPCYCDSCNGKHSHYEDEDECYCNRCRGRKTHY